MEEASDNYEQADTEMLVVLALAEINENIQAVMPKNIVVKIVDGRLYFIFLSSLFTLFYFSFFFFLFNFLFLEQLGLEFISHAVTSVTN